MLQRLRPRFEQQMMNHLCIEGVPALRRTPSFGVEDLGDVRAFEALSAQFGGARRQARVGAERGQTRDGTPQLVRRAGAAAPMAFDPNLFRVADDLDQDPSSSSRMMVWRSFCVVGSACQRAGRSCDRSRIAAGRRRTGSCARA